MLETGSETVYRKAFPEKTKTENVSPDFPEGQKNKKKKKHLVRDYIGSKKTKTLQSHFGLIPDSLQSHS